MSAPENPPGQLLHLPQRRRPTPTHRVAPGAVQNPVIVALDIEARRIADTSVESGLATPVTRLVAAAMDVCAARTANDPALLRQARRRLARILIAQAAAV